MRIPLNLSLCLALCTAMISGAAIAGPKLTLKEKRIKKKVEKELQDEMKKTNKACDAKIKVSVDWQSFKKANTIAGTLTRIASACEFSIEEVAKVCRDDDGKAAVKEGVKKIVCTYQDAENQKLKPTLAKGTLTHRVWVKQDGGEYRQGVDVSDFLAENL